MVEVDGVVLWTSNATVDNALIMPRSAMGADGSYAVRRDVKAATPGALGRPAMSNCQGAVYLRGINMPLRYTA
ncbi:hypothetical protein GUI43_03901 [Micromonospora noduli]|nr:hypothetical protein GUI43_03901 [Micromonospora noduli]